MNVKHILVPVDFSQISDNAVKFAAVLSKKMDAEVTLLHIVTLFKSDIFEPNEKLSELESIYQKSMNQAGKEIDNRQRYFENHIPIHKVVLKGISESDAILDYIRSNPTDLVIMGTHGRSGFKHILQGSVTEKLIRLSPVPVLAVHPEYHVKEMKKIGIGVDLSEYSYEALKTGLRWAKLFDTEVYVYHIVQKDIHPSYYAAGISSLFELNAELKQTITEKLESFIKNTGEAKGVNKISIRIEEGKPYKELLELTQNMKIDMLIIGSHGLTGLDYLLMGSTAEKVVRHSKIPVLVTKKL